MPVTGLFDGLEQLVQTSVEDIQNVLEEYPSSEAGKSLKSFFSSEYYHFYGDLWQGLDQRGDAPSKLFKRHIVERLSLDLNLLSLALYRCFRRALYCKCFNGIDLAQMKQAGLFAYWITKMRPILVARASDDLEPLDNSLEMALQEINERFAFYIIRTFYKEEFGRDIANINNYQTHFVHAVRFRSFTEDSMMLLTESLGVSSNSIVFGSLTNSVY